MPHVAPIARTTRQFVFAAAGALALATIGTAGPAQAQTVFIGYSSGPSVTVDYSVLDRLGPPPQVLDGRFVLKVPARPGARPLALHQPRAPHHTRVLARRAVHHRPVRVALHRPNHAVHVAQRHPAPRGAQIVHEGSVTIDYGALPAPVVADVGPRIILRRPGTATVAAAAPAVAQPEAPLTSPGKVRATQQAVVLTPPVPRPTPSPSPTAPSPPRVATTPPAPDARPGPRSNLPELSSLLPIGGVALAATRSPTEPVTPHSVPQSDSRTIRFAPGAADLEGDASRVLDTLAQSLKTAPHERIELVAYASGDTDQAIEARRVSLARAVAVRAYLIEHGVASSRIDVRALGNRVTGGGSADRVDLVTIAR